MSPQLRDWLTANVAQKVVDGMASEGTPFTGILFCGIMMTHRNGQLHPMVLEFNTRFGDPETQAILLRLDTDILDLFNASIDGTANQLHIKMKPGASVCVIAASGGYPGKYTSGKPITGLAAVEPTEDLVVFHSAQLSRTELSSPQADESSPSPHRPRISRQPSTKPTQPSTKSRSKTCNPDVT